MDLAKIYHSYTTLRDTILRVSEILDLPFDQVQCIDTSHGFVRGRGLFALGVGQRLERLEEASPRVRKKADVH